MLLETETSTIDEEERDTEKRPTTVKARAYEK
jgi:hypothetical protein